MNKLEQAARQALEALEEYQAGNRTEFFGAITALREALAEQAEQRSDSERMEPVEIGSVLQKVMSRLTELLDEDQFNNINSIVETSGYAAPVCTKDLTDYEIEKAIGLLNGYDAFRAVIAADREKNK